MSDTVIRVENLSKKYIIGHQQQERYIALRDVIANKVKSIGSLIKNSKSQISNSQEEFWALKDVSFEIKQGECIGIIGRNGAGKSTLLKILSRITEPTKGRINIKGRVASLLEVGTGFHPELTGRENIYLNGAILGMSKTEIQRKFDEIVAFAEIEKFLDTPVKRYSSGMYVRLAFAVAAHLEPEILIVDEVLAVGDVQFQKKCLGKMGDVASQEGRTVIFVSHQITAVNKLCSSCIVLHNGSVNFFGDTISATQQYLELGVKIQDDKKIDLNAFRASWARPLIKSARLLNSNNEEQTIFELGSDITIEMTFATEELVGLEEPVMGVVINHVTQGTVGGVNTRMTGYWLKKGIYFSAKMRCSLKEIPLLQGDYTVDIWLGDGITEVDTLSEYLRFTMKETDIYKTGITPFGHMGVIFLQPTWDVKPD